MHIADETGWTLGRELQARAGEAVLARATRENRRKEIVIATVAHELRNLMAPLDCALQILDRAKDEPQLVERTLPVARRQLDHLCHLVDDLMDMSRIVNDRVLVERKPLVLQHVVQECVTAFGPVLEKEGIHLDLQLDAEPAWMRGDPLRWTQIITNLLQNAAKFTATGGHVWVHAGADEENGTAVVRVRDDGCGIARAELEAIFGLFHRERRARARPGLGIGLALVRRLVDLHGGTIEAASEGPNRGATFTVRVPLAQPPRPRPITRPAPLRRTRLIPP